MHVKQGSTGKTVVPSSFAKDTGDGTKGKNKAVTVDTRKTIKRLQADARRKTDVLDKLEVAYRLYMRIRHKLHYMRSVDPGELLDILKSQQTKTWSEAVIRLIFNDPELSDKQVSDYAKVIALSGSFCSYVNAFKSGVNFAGGIDGMLAIYTPEAIRFDEIYP
ncbi:MAG: hypothetical protein WD071_10835 [Pseudohongiella sp.]|uniref:hypothetical protein n=1 Tax=Pseudohongiella sp. TaxID=1979412 RepID=UPI0034A07AC8